MLSYLGVFVHFVNEKFELTSRFLELRYLQQSHTDDYLCEQLRLVTVEWGIQDKVKSITYKNL